MRISFILITIFLLMYCNLSYGDIINTGYHAIRTCNKVTNLENYPEISLLAYTEGTFKYPTYEISNNKCLELGSRYTTFSIYAVRKSYLKGKDITKLDLPNDKNAIKANAKFNFERLLVKDSNTVHEIDYYYKIIGFTDTSLVLFKFKEEHVRTNEVRDSAIIFEYEGDISKLSQQLPIDVHETTGFSTIEFFPNPKKKNLNLKISNDYKGKIQVQIVSMEGKLMRTLFLHKTKAVLDYEIPIGKLPKGDYLANFEFGKQKETKRFMVE